MLEYPPKRRRVSGLRVDPHKARSTRHPIADDFVPEQLFIPVENHHGRAPTIIVRAGQRVLRGETLAEGERGSGVADVHASSSGHVREISNVEIQTSTGAQQLPCVVIDTDGRDAAIEESGTGDIDPGSESRPDRIDRVRRAGIVGLGGAAASTSWKLTRSESVPTLIINGAECEPYISCDDMLMRERASEILSGSLTLCDLLDAQLCIVAIERDKPQAIAAIREAATKFADARLSLAELPSIYPAGGERQLVELLIDAEVPTGKYPADIGIICQNVGTACAVHNALTRNEPLISRVVTLTGGGIVEPRNVYARIGTMVADLIAHFGGYADDPAALIVGGSMMGIAQTSDAVPVTKATNCILVPDADEFGATNQEWPCIRCGECAGACPARLLPQELLRATQHENSALLENLGLDDCIECGCCDAICPSHIALTQRFIAAKQLLSYRHKAQVFAAASQSRFDSHTQRLAEQEHLEHENQESLRARLADSEAKKRSIAEALERARQRSSKPVDDQ